MSWFSTGHLPAPYDKQRLQVAWARWDECSARPSEPAFVSLLETLFGNSPYLTDVALQNADFVADLWSRGPDAVMAALRADVAVVAEDASP